ncbi:MAG TPA: GNAT family N-acetyltransferase [Balneolales bacterium]|nr:GNAT family N-acetyltransferase [Balneolales bacterium]
MSDKSLSPDFEIREGTLSEIPTILTFIKELAEYEKMSDDVVANEKLLKEHLFGEKKSAEVVIAYYQNKPVGFALYFYNFSTFLGRPGLYLEDLYVRKQMRGNGFGKALLKHLAKIATQKKCGRMEWAVLNWNEPSIQFYKSLGANPMNDWTVYRVTGNALKELGS